MGVRLVTVVACLACAGAAARPAAADDDHEKALETFQAARAAIAAGDCVSAIPKLEESLAYEPSVGAHLSIADCYEQVDLVAAWRKLQEAAELAVAKNDPREGIARDRAAALEPRLSMMHFAYVPAGTDLSGLTVRIDGVLEPLLGRHASIPTRPGAHDVEVSLPHKKTWRGRIVAGSAGTVIEVDVPLEDDVATSTSTAGATALLRSAPESPSEESSSGGTQRAVALGVGGAGLAGIGVGAVFGILALSDNAKLRDACGGDIHHCLPGASNVTSLQSSARTAATVSTVGFVVGGAAMVAGIILYTSATPSRRIEIRAAAAEGAAGILVGGPFD
ncbi:MAG TPA: hypothetical protein VK762_27270 [Polyangiaceae bacterium]|nr:hypothetical protein [Polyangiaceae bacterium]